MSDNVFNILDFYRNIVQGEQLAQRNAYKVQFSSIRGFQDSSQTSSLYSKMVALTPSNTDQSSTLIDFNLKIEEIEFPNETRIDTNDSGSIWVKSKMPSNAMDFGPTLKIKFFDVKESPVDLIFTPWMKEVTSPTWHDDVPYPISTVVIEFHRLTADGNDIAFQTYEFYGLYPVAAEFPVPSKSPETIISEGRIVEFEYSGVKTYGQTST